ncbi:2OG-Fe(II) oxygenase [Pseudarthrobacter psychrotolerans]|uniref:2OG-Fe(II) oxygenase n=1 Tax=Pseudarthrobacter psychrotolerans TaxID=2697569 RepID=A0A6P1NJF3_9MICC|nr:2OG-Fe(II) oxygenase [Pseudarthrobacter psychrotolerans]QHK18927.1 2OG-Fe(II) oxygenase [Pseudarthrobacter psychrotolerans]
MPKPARDRLAQLLAGTEPARADSAMLRLPGNVLTLEVADLGLVQTPIRAAQAKKLIAVARPAVYGRGEQTLSDTSVRDTLEVAPDRVRLGGPSWQTHLDGALEHFREELGLPAGARLTAELHSLLVYGKGQFFLPHQDSEKYEEMVASLVVMLPSVHTGGELVVDDAGSEQVYGGSRNDLVLVAFYADRRHEVRPVRSGYRVTLTFNLLLTSPSETSEAGPVEKASSCLIEHFTTRVFSKYGGRDLGEPTRLAFLLDHEYTQGGLAAGRFKGADAERVATLLAAAQQAGCQNMLALAEIRETWDVLPDEDTWQGGWYDDEADDNEADDDEPGTDDDAHQLNELIDDEITLSWWTSADGSEAETIRLALDEHEVCMVTPTESITPYETEYEGYMGNYGNTLDRWYRRAAVIVWPQEKAFAVRAEAGSAWGLRSLLDRIDAGKLDGARADAASLKPFWTNIGPEVLTPALRVAAGLDDAVIARVVVAPFRIQMLTADHAPLLAALAQAYGDPWVLDLIGSWQSPNRVAGLDQLTWATETLLPLCQKLRQHEASPIADGCADLVWRWLWNGIDMGMGQKHSERRHTYLAELGEPLSRVLEAASDELGTAIAEALQPLGDNVVELLVPVLRAHRLPPNPALLAIAHDCRDRLTRLVGRPPRAGGDWSITWTGCGCGLCDRLAEFLAARSERTHEWPLATPGRQHIHQQIDASGLPVRHTTRRQGRPYTLLLAKTKDLFHREDEVRWQTLSELAWLATAFE